MNLREIKEAVDRGDTVHWATKAYRVIKGSVPQYLIICKFQGYCIGLTHADDKTLNGKEEQFFIGD